MSTAPALSVLTCSACGAAVAVAREAYATCAHCGQAVVIPGEYRRALDVAEEEALADRVTRDAFATLGKPPSLGLRIADALTAGWTGLLTVLFVMFGVAVLCDALLAHGPAWLHVNLWDWLSSSEVDLLWVGLTFCVSAGLFVLGAFGRRHAVALGDLRRALAAHAPTHPGGPARCRGCGAPLTVAADTVGVRCLYCRVDNLVTVRAEALTRAHDTVRHVAQEAELAFAAHRRELRWLYLRLTVRLMTIALLGAAILTSTVTHVLKGDGGPFDLRAALTAKPRRLFDLALAPTPAAQQILVDQCAALYVEQRNRDLACLDGDCWAGWFVALRKGEQFAIGPRAAGTAHLFAHHNNAEWQRSLGHVDAWGDEIAAQRFAPNETARFVAPLTSWYRVALELHGVGDEVALCARIDPPTR